MTIIQAQLEHLEVVVPLFDAYRQFYRKASDKEGARRFIEARLRNGDSVLLLAMDDEEQAVGFTQCYPAFSSVRMRPIWILNDLFVAPTARRQGVAQALMDEAARYARHAGVIALALATEKDNDTAKALYEQLGYEQDTAFDYYELTL
ncbi:MAG TPA: GNAT family N-acetyltransferase [Rhodothermales bacterium]|nr:GNAT family N-acetyltransferase [Rhodothermales bacterium]